MLKNKKVWLISATACAVIAASGYGIFIYVSHTQQSAKRLSETTETDYVDSTYNSNDAVAEPGVTSSQNPSPTPQSTSTGAAQNQTSAGLSVRPTTTQSPQALQQTQQQKPADAPAQAQQNPFDPKTYGQYEKYKSETRALMGDAQMGDGAELKAGNTAVVYYRGWLTNGTLFDQSRVDASGKLQTFEFTMGSHQVISGWEQGLIGMKAGGVRLLVIPPSAGYGASGQGSIPPNSVLVFQVQLVAVK